MFGRQGWPSWYANATLAMLCSALRPSADGYQNLEVEVMVEAPNGLGEITMRIGCEPEHVKVPSSGRLTLLSTTTGSPPKGRGRRSGWSGADRPHCHIRSPCRFAQRPVDQSARRTARVRATLLPYCSRKPASDRLELDALHRHGAASSLREAQHQRGPSHRLRPG